MASFQMSFSSLSNPKYSNESKYRKRAIKDALDGVKVKGTFGACGSLTEFVDPHVKVDSGGAIPLPLLAHDADRIIAASHRPQSEEAHKTVTEPSTRRIWGLDRHQVIIGNTSFRKPSRKLWTGLWRNCESS
ncbi:hypothetical protein EJ03DRAFT_122769 [Teratosphaeria nubilosa]|uniref:Uncharacterized protein n=1 Tax=Teratosphaeria nubilosa TaxID=161662 RepID=A0A6G1L6Q2_9PEZI|nr:hypothetical protein EJ03DRAFT_122769 [Teratosphaeria nubilosa]